MLRRLHWALLALLLASPSAAQSKAWTCSLEPCRPDSSGRIIVIDTSSAVRIIPAPWVLDSVWVLFNGGRGTLRMSPGDSALLEARLFFANNRYPDPDSVEVLFNVKSCADGLPACEWDSTFVDIHPAPGIPNAAVVRILKQPMHMGAPDTLALVRISTGIIIRGLRDDDAALMEAGLFTMTYSLGPFWPGPDSRPKPLKLFRVVALFLAVLLAFPLAVMRGTRIERA